MVLRPTLQNSDFELHTIHMDQNIEGHVVKVRTLSLLIKNGFQGDRSGDCSKYMECTTTDCCVLCVKCVPSVSSSYHMCSLLHYLSLCTVHYQLLFPPGCCFTPSFSPAVPFLPQLFFTCLSPPIVVPHPEIQPGWGGETTTGSVR